MRLADPPFAAAAQLPVAPLAAFLLLFDLGCVVTVFGGQTIGKIAVGLRVERTDGSAVAPVRALMRASACLISVAPLGVGFAGMLLGSRRTLHDLLADTRVVRAQ